MQPFVTLASLEEVLRQAWCAETAWSPGHWSDSNPAAGQCFSTAYVVMSLLGGEIVHAEVLPHTEPKQRHAWNRLPSGLLIDLTRQQFGPETRFRECDLPEALVWQHGGRQAQLLLQRVVDKLGIGR